MNTSMLMLHIKYVLCLFAFVFITGNVLGQEDELPRNEIKTNVLGVVFSEPSIHYERILNAETGVGVNLVFILEDSNQLNYALLPNVRKYFGKKMAAGFFVEGEAIFGTYSTFSKRKVAVGIGLLIGAKILTKKNLVIEIFAGPERLFTEDVQFNVGGDIQFRLGVSVGKRF